MERCRAADHAAGPADARMAAYLDGKHHPQRALGARTAFVALAEDEMVGYIAGHATTRHGCAGEVQYLYVASAFRRRGVAGMLLRCLAVWFADHGIHRVCVNVNVESQGAAPFYRQLGAAPLNQHWYIWDDIGQVLISEEPGPTRPPHVSEL
jgi:GNAT superfamily N-acetyltransferase